jgi:hypothetical protein
MELGKKNHMSDYMGINDNDQEIEDIKQEKNLPSLKSRLSDEIACH